MTSSWERRLDDPPVGGLGEVGLDRGERRLVGEEVVERVYADVPREVWPAAELSVEAQLAYLRRH
jgi:hypothetical protein